MRMPSLTAARIQSKMVGSPRVGGFVLHFYGFYNEKSYIKSNISDESHTENHIYQMNPTAKFGSLN